MDARTSLKIEFEFDTIVGFLYFSISHISRMFLQFAGIPRELTYGLYLVVLAFYFIKYLPRLKAIDGVYYLLVFSVVGYGLRLYSSYIDSKSRLFAVLLLFLPSYLFFRIYDQQKMVNVFILSQFYAAAYLLIYYFLSVRYESSYSMDYGYWVILPIITFIFLYFEKRLFICVILAVLFSATLVLSGNRGALLLGILCCIYYYVFSEANNNRGRKWLARVIVLGSLLVMLVFTADFWLNYISKFAKNSRTIRKLIDGSLLQSSTRDRLYARVNALIANKKSGYGPMASRKFLTGEPYPHSLLYELQLDFGVIIGTAFCVAIIGFAVMNLIYYRKSALRIIVGYVEIIGIGSLMVSSSFYYEIFVPATIALFIISREKARRIKQNNEVPES